MDLANCTTVHHKSTSSKVLLSLTLSLLAVLTTAINSLVIAAIVVTRKLHHPANYLICSLAVTDLLVAILVMPFSIVYIIKETWIMGQAVCAIWLGVDITCCTCSILHLAAIALDRYRAITDAVEYSRKRTSLRATLTVAVVWVLSILISLPPLVWRHQGNHGDECLIKHDHIAFTLYSTFGAFYIPLALILVLYYKIYRAAKTLYHRRGTSRLSRPEANGSVLPKGSDRDPRSPDLLSLPEKSYSDPSTEGDRVRIALRSPRFESRRQGSFKKQRLSGSREKRAATTLGLILGAFIVCWLPFFLKEVIVNTCSSCSLPAEMADFLTWLGYLNSLINPLIYTIFNEDFKKAFQKLVTCRYYL
ncbi:5-hydroxytryptamine receptor 1F-like [Anguilla anguilla]|uniref:5-hydroxytryptamine receptor 1F-like n=1 Tax=Anguilla anguilla TaxID=7936 RepID=UPI0015B255EB|nr:5-hydroxytryptamine receptor 1F-like [Anguilla anguilla]XP_035248506.1 5-hydroxytryptamine receptor 1F-like [Anguilla anguilla]XP_035248507.1 5-hydroxytryptamine receptor 1F-like [Anguilla anguilla]XP_035248508.1 5-hydroxytryptamine receptor 1F-like [Anguilla anguilla]XP_035248509.1 5-hydroxytryptamine receptor 1F-like [Anguilla anguilla]XP_035248510.1 5-hydroxytryptamine receptor 1F-like [Anguilla anguilla]XP_035248511.1 5-hydroxytryptamine receptor 1F-like [Anguilla anguilla]XP_03524851